MQYPKRTKQMKSKNWPWPIWTGLAMFAAATILIVWYFAQETYVDDYFGPPYSVGKVTNWEVFRSSSPHEVGTTVAGVTGALALIFLAVSVLFQVRGFELQRLQLNELRNENRLRFEENQKHALNERVRELELKLKRVLQEYPALGVQIKSFVKVDHSSDGERYFERIEPHVCAAYKEISEREIEKKLLVPPNTIKGYVIDLIELIQAIYRIDGLAEDQILRRDRLVDPLKRFFEKFFAILHVTST